MAGYRLEFDGGLVEKRDVNQVTTGNSLTASTTTLVSPNGTANGSLTNWNNINSTEYINRGVPNGPLGTVWDFGVPTSQNYIAATGNGTPLSDAFIISGLNNLNTGGLYSSGQVLYTSTSSQNTWDFGAVTKNFPIGTTLQWDIRITGTSGYTIYQIHQFHAGNGGRVWNQGYNLIFTQSVGPTSFISTGTVTLTGSGYGYLAFLMGGSPAGAAQSATIEHIRVYEISSSPMIITESTVVNGVQPTGGSPTSATPSTIVKGAAGGIQPPSKFGLVAKHGGSDIIKVKTLPPADSDQDSSIVTSKSKVITATDTSISVEGENLSSVESLKAADTNILVKEYKGATEN